MKKLLFMVVVLTTLASCSHVRQKMYYEAIEEVAKYRAETAQVKAEMNKEILLAMFQEQKRVSTVPPNTYVNYANNDNQMVKYMILMTYLQQRENEHTLQNALAAVRRPEPHAGELAIKGATSLLPVALAIAGAAYGGYLIDQATNSGAEMVIQGQGALPPSNTSNEYYNVNSHNTQTATVGQSNGRGNGGGAGRGGRSSDDMANIAGVNQGMAFEANNPAMRSPNYQAPFNTVEPIIPVVLP